MSGINDSKIFYTTTGKNIKKYRDLRNYSLQVLAEKVGLTKKTIQRYENGDIKIDMNRLKDLSIALDVSVAKLMEGTGVFFSSESMENAKILDSYENEREFEEKIDLSDNELLEKFSPELDGEKLSQDEFLDMIAYLRVKRQMKK